MPVIRAVLAKAPAVDGVQTFRAQYRLQALKALCDKALENLDCVLTPSIPRPVTLAELDAEPVLRNSQLGYYTNFMNLLDYAAVAVPSAFMADGLPWGVTLFGRVFTDQYLLSLADALQRQSDLPLIGAHEPGLAVPATVARNGMVRLVVCGAHLEGLALIGSEATRRAPAGNDPQLCRLSALRPGGWPALTARHGPCPAGRRGHCGGSLGTAEQ